MAQWVRVQEHAHLVREGVEKRGRMVVEDQAAEVALLMVESMIDDR